MQNLPVLSILILVPILGAIPIAFFRRSETLLTRTWTLLVTLVELALAVGVALSFNLGVQGPQFVERLNWIPTLGVQYYLGADGISVALIVLTAVLAFVSVIASWRQLDNDRGRLFAGLLLLLEAAVIGNFMALDLVLFFVFWEAMLIPAYLIVGIYGGERRVYAAYKFFLYTAIGSLLMLVGIVALYVAHTAAGGTATFDVIALSQTPVSPGLQTWIFLAFALAFAIKVPIWPLHTWLPDLYTETPIGAMVLVTMLAKVGAYGFLRFAIPLFPSAAVQFAPLFAALGLVGIIYGGLTAFTQRNMVGVVAYSSIAHLGFIILGIFSLTHQSMQGAVVQMVNHGISAGALFLIAGAIYERVGSTDFDRLGGLAAKWPILAAFALVAVLSSVGMPGLNGFVGEFLIVYGSFVTNWVYAVIAAIGIVIAAVYLISMYRRAMHGTPALQIGGSDLSGREIASLVPLVVLVFAIGIYPSPLLNSLENSVSQITAQVRTVQVAPSQIALQRAGSAR